jgi:serine/threonine protein phosphatase PrpC
MNIVSVQKFCLRSVKAVALSDRGKQRKDNQDSYGIVERDCFRFYMVADGMGGARAGGVASDIAVAEITNVLTMRKVLTPGIIIEAIQKSNESIFEVAYKRPECSGMGTTISGIGFSDSTTLVCNVGDSRVYRKRGLTLSRLTQDHTFVAEMVKNGHSPNDVMNSPMAHVLTRALGVEEYVEPDVQLIYEAPEIGDRYLVCSDGVHGMIGDKTINELMGRGDVENVAQGIINESLAHGGLDNITAIVIEILPSKYLGT